jgi:hypothetical protein|tara:strand:- start:1231 stop:1452 length:222 start_codon:yes stop_codon:yes gene_type:complete
MPTLIVDLDIPAHEYLAMYQGRAKNVIATARDGTSIQFPASNLRPFVTGEGIAGGFRIRFDASHKLLSVERIS